MRVVAIDWETFYSDSYSVTTLGTYNYTHNPYFSPYWVSISCPEIKYSGSPILFDWTKLEGYDTACAHNSAFDSAVHNRAYELGIVTWNPSRWICTANLSVYICGLRSLKNACKYILGKEVEKEIRDELKGLTLEDIKANQTKYDELVAKAGRTKSEKVRETALKASRSLPTIANLTVYAQADADASYAIYEKHIKDWPDWEQRISEMTILQGKRGVYIDQVLLEKSIKRLEKYKELALSRIPWVKEGLPPLSKDAVNAECTKIGIVAPESMAKTSEEFETWMEKNHQHRWIKGMRSFRRVNMILEKLYSMKARIMPNGRMEYDLYYGGTHTLRNASGGGVNVLNLIKKKSYGFYIRNLICAPSDHKLAVFDLSQIEFRIAMALIKEDKMLDKIRSGVSPYQAYAEARMGFTGKDLKTEDPSKYALAKAACLSLIFRSGWRKLISMMRIYGLEANVVFNYEYTEKAEKQFLRYQEFVEPDYAHKFREYDELTKRVHVNAWNTVDSFRKSLPGLSDKDFGLWARFETRLKENVGGTYALPLPSGRKIKYREIQQDGRKITALIPRKKNLARFFVHGGPLMENTCQAIARDIFMLAMLECEKQGYPVVLNCYDELVLELKKEVALDPIRVIVTREVPWLKNCPVGCEGKEMEKYSK